MKARKKGTQEWKEYTEVFGPCGEFIGLETLGYTKSVDEIIAEMGIDEEEDLFARSRIQPQYMSAVLPLECFDLWEEPDWSAFHREAAKDILAGMMAHPRISYGSNYNDLTEWAIGYAYELIRQLKERQV